MADQNTSALAVLETLGFSLFRADTEGALRICGETPDWLTQLWPAAASDNEAFPAAELSPFLENFLIDAAECWRVGGEQRSRSGAWVEVDAAGNKFELEATALTAKGERLLLLERLGEVYATKKSLLQIARENVIAQQRLNSEIEKKEILLHCVAEEMSGALANVITSLRLLQAEETSARSTMLLELALRGAEDQRALIHKVLAVFAEELGGLFGQGNGTACSPGEIVQRASKTLQPVFAEKRVQLRYESAELDGTRVPVDAKHLERVFANVLENALEQAPPKSEVRAQITPEPDSILFEVRTVGSARAKIDARGTLRLQFCRMIVEGCGGEMGHSPNETEGQRFWLRLPRA